MTAGTHRGGPRPAQRAPRDHQAPSRAPLETPLGPPRPPTNPPKTLSRCFESPQSAKEGAQSLPNATQEAPKPQNTMKINEHQTQETYMHRSRAPRNVQGCLQSVKTFLTPSNPRSQGEGLHSPFPSHRLFPQTNKGQFETKQGHSKLEKVKLKLKRAIPN